MLIFFLFVLEEASNASLTAHNRIANVGSYPYDDGDNDDDVNSGDYPDDYDDFWYDEEYREFDDPPKKEPHFLKSEQMAVFMAEKNESFLSKMGHSFEDMVLSCTYRGVPCRLACVAWRFLSNLRARGRRESRDKKRQSREEPG